MAKGQGTTRTSQASNPRGLSQASASSARRVIYPDDPNPNLTVGSLVMFSKPIDDYEKTAVFEILEDNGSRIIVRDITDTTPLPGTRTFLKADLEEAGKDRVRAAITDYEQNSYDARRESRERVSENAREMRRRFLRTR